MRVAVAAAAGAAALAVVLAGCAAEGSAGQGGAGAAAPYVASPTAAERGPCPVLEPAPPREDGLPDLELPCLDEGPAVNLADLRGVPTVVNVWAAWCTNCEREMPLFADAVEKAGDRLRFFGVHYKAARAYGLRSEVDFGVPFPSVHDEDGDRVVSDLGAYAPPQTFFVTADGRVAGRTIGEITSAAQMAELVERYLGISL